MKERKGRKLPIKIKEKNIKNDLWWGEPVEYTWEPFEIEWIDFSDRWDDDIIKSENSNEKDKDETQQTK